MNEEYFKSFAENTITAISNMNDMINVQHSAVMVAGNELNELKNIVKIYQNKVDDVENSLKKSNLTLSENNEKIITIESKINVLDFDEEGRYQEFKNICKKRNLYLCGNNESNPEYILFYRTLMSNIYKYISDTLHVARTGKIKTEDFEGAKSLARSYRPDKFKMNQKFKSIFKAYGKGTLSLEKSKAMEELLLRMNGSFDMNELFGGRCI